MSIEARADTHRWHLTLVPDGGVGDGHAREPYDGSRRHSGRVVIANPGGVPVEAAGVDLLDVRRWELASRRCGDWLERRVCSRAELAALPADPVLRLHEFGLLFSIKEAVLKAIGGIPKGARFPDITVSPPRPGRACHIALTGETARHARRRGVELLAGALPIRDGLALSWAIATGPAPQTGRARR